MIRHLYCSRRVGMWKRVFGDSFTGGMTRFRSQLWGVVDMSDCFGNSKMSHHWVGGI